MGRPVHSQGGNRVHEPVDDVRHTDAHEIDMPLCLDTGNQLSDDNGQETLQDARAVPGKCKGAHLTTFITNCHAIYRTAEAPKAQAIERSR